jgi:alkylhydroperoxidase/carboxymuconolactone decarboxylase family protein YurZ
VTVNDARHTWAHLREAMGRLGAALPGPIGGLAVLQRESLASGALRPATKELIALAVAVALPEDRLIPVHVHDALAAGATEEELLEAAGVAVLMGGVTAAVRASEILDVIAAFRDGDVGRRHKTMRAAAAGADLGHILHGQDGDDAGLG